MNMPNVDLRAAACWLTVFVPVGLVLGNAASDSAVSVVAILFLLESFRKKDFAWLKKPWVAVLAALWLYGCLRAVVVADWHSLSRAAPWVRYFVFAAALEGWTLKGEIWRKRLVISIIASAGFLAADSLLQYFSGTDILGNEPVGHRLTASFKKPIVGVTIAWMFLPALAWLVGERRYAFAAAFAAFCFSAVLFSGERMALLFALSASGLAALSDARLRKISIYAAVLATILAGSVMYLKRDLYERQVESTVNVVLDFSESHYGIAWKSALDIFADYPLFGVGVLNFRKVCPDEKYGPAEVGEKNYSRCTNHTHNIYFEWLVEGGMIGFAGIMLFAFFVLREFLRILPSQKHNLVFIALAASAAMRLFPLSSSASFHSNWSAIPMWLAIGWALAYGTDRAEKSNA